MTDLTEAMALLYELSMENVLFYAVPSNRCWLTRAGGPKVDKPWAAFTALSRGQLIAAKDLGDVESIVQYAITHKGQALLAAQKPKSKPFLRECGPLECAMDALPFKGTMFLNLIGGYSGYHYWPGAPEGPHALSDPHFHTFRFEVVLKSSKDREIEFLASADALGESMEQWLGIDKHRDSSCELMAVVLAKKAWELWELDVVSVQVAEDSDSAALWVGDCKHARPWCVLAHNELGEYFDPMGGKETADEVMDEAVKLADELAADIEGALKEVDPKSTDQIRIDIHVEEASV